jgi:hypothetical protein
VKYVNFQGGIVEELPPYAETSVNGTFLIAEIEVPYGRIVEVFGKPNGGNDGFKTDAEWIIPTAVGVATIYNWKDGKNYLGDEGMRTEDISIWHIGGHDNQVVPLIKRVLGLEECDLCCEDNCLHECHSKEEN